MYQYPYSIFYLILRLYHYQHLLIQISFSSIVSYQCLSPSKKNIKNL
nr:MAG TPA: hypothetical protein [Caudoviricetes sp.]